MKQPFAGFAKTLLERQQYPDLREYPGGPPRRPYDVTAHTLPLLMGVKAVAVDRPFQVRAERVGRAKLRTGAWTFSHGTNGYLIPRDSNDSFVLINRLLREGVTVSRLSRSFRGAVHTGREFPIGTFFIPAAAARTLANQHARLALDAFAVTTIPDGLVPLRAPRVGVYKGYVQSMDEGWTRWVLERFEFPYTSLMPEDFDSTSSLDRFDAIVFVDVKAADIINGNPRQPPGYQRGIGEGGLANLKSFIERGGTAVTIDGSSDLALGPLGVKAVNPLQSVSNKDLYCPGSILRMRFDPSHPVAFGMDAEAPAWKEGTLVFDLKDPAIRQVAAYADKDLLMSGWLLGEQYLISKTSIFDAPIGKGRVIGLGFGVQYRAQAHSTFRLLFNSLYYASSR